MDIKTKILTWRLYNVTSEHIWSQRFLQPTNIRKECVKKRTGISSNMSGEREKTDRHTKKYTHCTINRIVSSNSSLHKVQLNYFSTQAQWMAVESLVTTLFLMNSPGWKEKQSIVPEKPSHTVTFTNQYQIVFKSCKSYTQHLCRTERRAQYGPHTVRYVHAPILVCPIQVSACDWSLHRRLHATFVSAQWSARPTS